MPSYLLLSYLIISVCGRSILPAPSAPSGATSGSASVPSSAAPAGEVGTILEKFPGPDDAAFLLGRNGQTKLKIARVSGATIEILSRENAAEITGPEKEFQEAMDLRNLENQGNQRNKAADEKVVSRIEQIQARLNEAR